MADFNVKLTYDNSELTRGLENDKRNFSDLANAVNQFERTTSTAGKNAARELGQVQQQTGVIVQRFGQAKAGADDFSKSADRFERVKKKIDNVSKSTKDLGGAYSSLPGPIGGAVRSVKSFTVAAKAFIATPLGLILAGIATALAAVRAAFTSSEEGQQRLNTVTTVFNAILGRLNDALAFLGDVIIDAFSRPQDTIKAIGDLIVSQIVNRIQAVPKFFQGAFDAVVGAFGVFSNRVKLIVADIPILGKGIDVEETTEALKKAEKRAVEGAKNMGKAYVEVQTGIEFEKVVEFGEKVIDQGKELIDIAEQATIVAEKRNRAEVLERELLLEREKLETRIAELRLKARQEDQFSAEQRAEFLKEASQLQDEIFDKETEVLQLRADAIALENTFSRTRTEAKQEEAEATAALDRAERNRLNNQRQLQRELNRVSNEANRKRKQASEQLASDINKIEEDLLNKQRQRLLSDAGSDESRVQLAKQFAKEELDVRRQAALELSTTEADRLRVIELFKELELKLEADFRDELNEAVRERIRDEQALEDDRLKQLEQLSQRQRQLRLQSLEAELSGNVSADRQREIYKERLELELTFENERAEALATAARLTEERIAEARDAGDFDRVQELERQLEDQLFEINENANRIIIAENELNSERINQQLNYIESANELQQREIEDQLKFGNLSIRQQRELERQRLDLARQTIEAQLALLPEGSVLADQFAENLRAIENEIRAFEQTTIPQLRGLGELFQETLLEQFGLDSDFTGELLQGFELLRETIFDSIRGGYDLELEAINNTISDRQKSISDLEKAIDAEQRARDKGYANNVDALEERLEAEQALLLEDEQRKNEIKIREARFEAQIQSLQQGVQLATAVANIIRSESRLGAAGVITAGAAIVSMFAIWRKFRAQSEQLSQPVSLFTGGRIGDYLKSGHSPRSDKPGYGRGHMIEGTNIRVGADEWLLNAKTSQKQDRFLGLMNSGALDNVDLYSVFRNGYLKPDTAITLKNVSSANKQHEEMKAERNAKLLAKAQASEMRGIIKEQTDRLEQLDNRRPVIIPMPNGKSQRVSYSGDKKVVEVVR